MVQQLPASLKREIEAVLEVCLTEVDRGLDTWGEVDYRAMLGDGRVVFVEVENTQKHSCTNVLKVWPYLEEKGQFKVKVLLVHVFLTYKPKQRSNRDRLIENSNKGRTIVGASPCGCPLEIVQSLFASSISSWLGEKMQRELGDKFQYCQIVAEKDGFFREGIEALRTMWTRIKSP